MTRGGNRAGRTRGRGRGASIAPLTSSPSSSRPTDVATSGSPVASPIPSPSDSIGPPTSTSVVGPSAGSGLPVIYIEDGRLLPSHSCSGTMKKIFMQRIHPNGYTWKNVPAEHKASYFEEFKKFYKWDESIDRQVNEVFLQQAGIRYKDMVSKFKKNRTSIGKPLCVPEDTWRIWEAYWDRPNVKAKSEQQRKNRMTEVAGLGTGCSRHTGGSRSAIEHYHELEEIQPRVDAATQEAEASSEPPNIDMSKLYVDVVGGVKKQRIYGLGTKASSFINTTSSCSSSATSQLNQDTLKEEMERQMSQQIETMRAEMQAQIQAEKAQMQAENAQIQAQMQAENAQIQAQVTTLLEELRRHGMQLTSVQPPTTPGEHSANSNAADLGDK